MVKGIAATPVPAWNFQPCRSTGNHDAGSGRPVATEDMSMRLYNQPAPILLRRRSARQEPVPPRPRPHGHAPSSSRTCPPTPTPSSTPSSPSATASSSAASACSPGTGSPTCASDERIPFVLGHALAMKAIHGGKAKNDQIDAAKLAGLLRGGCFPMAYVYPQGQARRPATCSAAAPSSSASAPS